ncbi:MAG: lysylphosphatidylglycerol synthase transmembrane domain-containing protein [Candidatus Omnitrophica bacterium]|nr:lysylphosphatidylglycerol synthase transmembrane domain-containing protein [Candidatus Omnitrophota bacterium]
MIKKLLRWALFAVILTLGVLYINRHPEGFLPLHSIPAAGLIILSALNLAQFFLRALLMKVYLRPFSVSMGFREYFGMDMLAALLNYLPVPGGTFSRAIYLKNRHRFSYTDFTVLLGAMNVISVFSIGLTGSVSMSILYSTRSISNIAINVLFLTLVSISVIVFVMPVDMLMRLRLHGRIMSLLRNGIEHWNRLKISAGAIGKLTAINIMIVAMAALRLFFLFKYTGAEVPLFSCLAMASLSSLAVIVPVTPSGLGIREAAVAVMSQMLGASFAHGLAISVADRLIGVAWTFICGAVFIPAFLHRHNSDGADPR